jgi:hypothetical protein
MLGISGRAINHGKVTRASRLLGDVRAHETKAAERCAVQQLDRVPSSVHTRRHESAGQTES